jgi:hypothetical protein
MFNRKKKYIEELEQYTVDLEQELDDLHGVVTASIEVTKAAAKRMQANEDFLIRLSDVTREYVAVIQEQNEELIPGVARAQALIDEFRENY